MTRGLPLRLVAVVALLLLVPFALAACGDDDDRTGNEGTPATTATPSATATATHPPESPTATSTPLPANRTGDPAIDAVLDAVEARDAETLRSLVAFTSVPCTSSPMGVGSPPLCPSAVQDRTPVDVFPASACEGYYTYPDGVQTLLNRTLESAPRLVAVYRTVDKGTPVFPQGEVVALFERTDGPSRGFATSFGLNAQGRIVIQAEGCAATPAQRLDRIPAANLILGPLTY